MNTHVPSYERNREPILQVLQKILGSSVGRLLEVGSGSGHHAVFFAPHFPSLQWQTSDVKSQQGEILRTLRAEKIPNVLEPLEFEVGRNDFPPDIQAVFSANTLHIMSEEKVRALVKLLGRGLPKGAPVIFYGPFNKSGAFTSQSNADFDLWLKSVDPERGIRNFEDVCRWMGEEGFHLEEDVAMPSNNRLLHFKKY
jgi:cyclopropane fatty-acyl-phospholipid synthase-like methyltransferase